MQALTNYALYGSKNKVNNVLSNAKINAINAKELVDKGEITPATRAPAVFSHSSEGGLRALLPWPARPASSASSAKAAGCRFLPAFHCLARVRSAIVGRRSAGRGAICPRACLRGVGKPSGGPIPLFSLRPAWVAEGARGCA